MSDQEKRIQEIRERANAAATGKWGALITNAQQDIPYLLDLLDQLQRERQERDSIKKLIGPSADMPTTTAMRELVNSINAKNLGAGIDYSADKDIICVAFAYGDQASYAVRAIEEKLKRENPEPIRWKDLPEFIGKPVWMSEGEDKQRAITCVLVVACDSGWVTLMSTTGNPSYRNRARLGEKFDLYATEPKGEHHD